MLRSNEKVFRYLVWTTFLGTIAGLSACLGMVVVIYYQIYFGDDSHLKKSTILAKINEETSIYYLDGKTKLGSFFDSGHRKYLQIDEVPAYLINAIVAAEDKRFYEHSGVDGYAIFNSFIDGLRKGRFRGGSTITMQTVRNILDRWERTFSRKFREIIAAYQLERMYSKRQILEFYLNQFHVAHNGHGVGVAAKYYFDKEVKDIGLVEAAFIAGSVKGPSKYNPFLQYTEAGKKKAMEEAFQRKNYVLRRMYEQGWISEEELKGAWEQAVPFKKGKFSSSDVSQVQMIKDQVSRTEILDALNMESSAELSTAGLNIFTTLDNELQDSAQLAMRRNLSRLQTILEGFNPQDNESQFRKLRILEVNQFFYGKVEEIKTEKDQFYYKLDFGLPKGTLPYESLVRFAKLLDLPTGSGVKFHLDEIRKKVKVGTILFVEVKDYNPETHEAIVELHNRPKVDGGLITLDKGEVRAVVSGFDTIGFNRAVFAKRQPGSVFKCLVYYAALQLGWSILDKLDNERQIFPYQGRFYYPRPDHPSEYNDVSMVWAGTLSENVASVSLTSKLVEKLSIEQFKYLMGIMGLLPEDGESPADYNFRVARKIGVQLDNDGVRENQLKNAINDLAPDFVFEGKQKLLRRLTKMWWGKGYTGEIKAIYASPIDDVPVKEKARRLKMVKNNYLRMQRLLTEMTNDWKLITSKVNTLGAEAAFHRPELRGYFKRFMVLPSEDNRPALGYFNEFSDEAVTNGKYDLSELNSLLAPTGRELNALDVQSIWGGSDIINGLGSAGITFNDVLLDGYLPINIYNNLDRIIEEKYNTVMKIEDKYDLARYYEHHDFRIGIGLNYLVQLCKAMGVSAKMEPVLSFPLGTNDVSAAEVAKIFQTFISSKVYRFYKEGLPNQINFIKRIEDRYGNVVYEPVRKDREIARVEYAYQMREIMRKVITHGTGRRARGELYFNLGDSLKQKVMHVPAFGKTGTTNDYTTAYFSGFIPYPIEKNTPLDPENSYVIASYVGYDLNKTMHRGRIKVYGGVGALPLWTDFGKELIVKKKYADFVDNLDIATLSRKEWPIKYPKLSVPFKVDLPRGIILPTENVAEEDDFATTDIAKTGESYQSEFALGPALKSIVMLPREQNDDTVSPLRMFSPVEIIEEGDEKKGPSDLTVSSKISDKEQIEGLKNKDIDQAKAKMDNLLQGGNKEGENQEKNTPPPSPEKKVDIYNIKEDPSEYEFIPHTQKEETGPSEKNDNKEKKDSEGGFTEEDLW